MCYIAQGKVKIILWYKNPYWISFCGSAQEFVTAHFVTGVGVVVVIAVDFIDAQSLLLVRLDGLQVVAQEMAGRGVLFAVTSEPVLDAQVLKVLLDLVFVFQIDPATGH